MKRGVAILFLSVSILPNLALAQVKEDSFFSTSAKASVGEGITLPKDWGEIKAFGQMFWDATIGILPNFVKKIWKEEVLPFWRKMGDWVQKNILNPYIYPFFNKEIKTREPIIEAEFQKEKKEMKESIKTEVPKLTKSITDFSIWEKIKELIK
ncbi:MAG: hypothetical protein Q7S82_04110 [bacterium]|nr:hypothetical protein [bacterium]